VAEPVVVATAEAPAGGAGRLPPGEPAPTIPDSIPDLGSAAMGGPDCAGPLEAPIGRGCDGRPVVSRGEEEAEASAARRSELADVGAAEDPFSGAALGGVAPAADVGRLDAGVEDAMRGRTGPLPFPPGGALCEFTALSSRRRPP
jgi:hypothetical protein